MKNTVLIFSILILFFFFASFKETKTNSQTLILCQFKQGRLDRAFSKNDSIYIFYELPYNDSLTINDSIKHYVTNFSDVTAILIAQPSGIIKYVDFKPFTNMSTLILAGNDFDNLDSLPYDFFNNQSLHKIINSAVYVKTITDHDPDYMGNKRFKEYVKAIRPDINVKFYSMGKYNKEGWGD